jgi:hypothetical protein
MRFFSKGWFVFVGFIVLSFLMLNGIVSTARAESSNRFQLVILKKDWSDLKLGYTFPEAFTLLKSAQTAGPLLVIGQEDIESYNWSRQSITLSVQATVKLMASLPPEDDWKPNNRFMAKVKREHGWGNPIEWALHQKGFLVFINEEPLFGGVFLEPMSQMAIQYPVIRPGLIGNKAVFYLLPVQLPFMVYDPASKQMADWDAAIAPEGSRDWNYFPAAMKSHFMNMGNSPLAQKNRLLIRNPKIKEIMEQMNKLVER